ncbi:MAG: HAD family phosphatase [Chloroflexi bacterium]|nr:HAD family phosphatase [Chloroflexota bacterium]
MAHDKALIFDLGNVVFKISFDNAFGYWANAAKADLKQIKDNYAFDEYYAHFEKNLITPDEFKNHLIEKLKIKFEGDAFEQGWNLIYEDIIPGIPELLTGLKKTYRLIALTNTNAVHYPTWATKYAKTLEIFEQVFSSHLIGHRKPEPAAYQVALDYLQMPPAQMWFFDDHLPNIIAAEKMGINAVLVTTFEKMIADMKRQGIT